MPLIDRMVGQEGRLSVDMPESRSADAYGNSGLAALASPALVGLVEQACMAAFERHLSEGERSVGSAIELEPTAPTPVGSKVEVVARIDSVDGRKVWFSVLASDATGEIARGRHARFIVDEERFQARLVAPRANPGHGVS